MLQGLANYMYVFHGKAAHASAAPWDGRNALNEMCIRDSIYAIVYAVTAREYYKIVG